MTVVDEVRWRTRARVAAHVLRDNVTMPTAVSGNEVPWWVDTITPEWLTDVLCGPTRGASVETVTIVGGDGAPRSDVGCC
jgi:hypothetical protein